MNPDTICRMNSEQIATALDRLNRELAAMLEERRVLQEERDRWMSARPRKE